MIWNNAMSSSNGSNANIVIGQSSFTSCSSPSSPTASSFNKPEGIQMKIKSNQNRK